MSQGCATSALGRRPASPDGFALDPTPGPGEHAFADRQQANVENERRVAAIVRGECPDCGHPLTDPAKSKQGWAWCQSPACRRPWRISPFGTRNKLAGTLSPENIGFYLKKKAQDRSES